MANRWTINILQKMDGTVAFRPDLNGAAVGQPLGVHMGDLVTWNNKTDRTITLVSISPPALFLTEPIPAGEASDPIFHVGDKMINYACVDPPQQQHIIVAVDAAA